MKEDLRVVEAAFIVGVVIGAVLIGYVAPLTLFGAAFILGGATVFTVQNLPKYMRSDEK